MDSTYKGGRKELMVVIKPSAESNYGNVVNLLDEMLINQIRKYTLTDLDNNEKRIISDKIR
ncbi:MAG TPA: hypothetical protein VMT76_04520 [Puia sp.]|nr:hypothetical protein [Puia sp.]